MRDARPEFAAWLREQGVVALTGLDTRTLVRRIRDGGVLRCALGDAPVEELHARALAEPFIDGRPLDRPGRRAGAVLGRRGPARRRRRPRLQALDPAAARRRQALEAYVVPGAWDAEAILEAEAARRADRERPRRSRPSSTTRSRRSATLLGQRARCSASASAISCSASRSATRPSSSLSAIAARTIPSATSRTGRVLVTVQNHGFAVDRRRRHLARLAERRDLRGPPRRRLRERPVPSRGLTGPARRACPSSTAWRTRAEAHRPSLDPDPRLRADPDRPGVRVRLLRRSGLPGAPARRLPGRSSSTRTRRRS